MKNLVVALVAFAFAAPAPATAQDLAPAVKRKPAAPAPAAAPAAARQEVAAPTSPAAPQPDSATSAGPVAAQPVAPRPAARTERDVQAALAAAAQGSGGPALDTGLLKMMGGLVIEGRCSEAASVAAQQGRTALAKRAAQLCR